VRRHNEAEIKVGAIAEIAMGEDEDVTDHVKNESIGTPLNLKGRR
jgi:hypothetical protein